MMSPHSAEELQPQGPEEKWKNLSVAAGPALLSPSTSGAEIISVRPLSGFQPPQLKFGLVCVAHPDTSVPVIPCVTVTVPRPPELLCFPQQGKDSLALEL